MPKTYDAIVVGSGITGGWAAKELTERGSGRWCSRRAGRSTRPPTTSSTCRPGRCAFRGLGDRKALERDQPVQSELLRLRRVVARKFFVNDRENPYTIAAGQAVPLDPRAARSAAGRSCGAARSTAGAISTSRRTLRDGIAVDWPIRYADIAPWYDHVERFIGVSGQAEGLAQLPDGQFLPPMELNCAERDGAGRDARSIGAASGC